MEGNTPVLTQQKDLDSCNNFGHRFLARVPLQQSGKLKQLLQAQEIAF